MARIRTTHGTGRTIVVVAGRLTASDMRRLEHACGEALTSRPPQLEIDITHVTHTDSTAVAILQRLTSHGAVVRGNANAV